MTTGEGPHYLHGHDLSLDEAEFAPTMDMYYKWAEKREPVQLSIEEQELLEAEVRAADTEAVEAALYTLVEAHMAEFETYLKRERVERDIDMKVSTGWKTHLDKIRERNIVT